MAAIKETFFISHGSPMLSIDESLPAHWFLKKFTETVFSQRPKAILIVSAHWDTSEPALSIIHGKYETIHDFYGFPRSLNKVFSPSSVLICLLLSVHFQGFYFFPYLN